jgi:molybdenum cofactor cytidylyltransferase
VTPRDSQPSTPSATYALLLAAGKGHRFGGEKLLASFHGRPLLQPVLDAIGSARSQGWLAGAAAVCSSGPVATLIEQSGILVELNRDPAAGLSHSLRLGLTALARGNLDPQPTAALIMLGDQPELSVETIRALVLAGRGQRYPIVRPRYLERPEAPGHPVLLDRTHWELADELSGDTGLGPLLRARSHLVTTIDLPGRNRDIDTAADLEALDRLRG